MVGFAGRTGYHGRCPGQNNCSSEQVLRERQEKICVSYQEVISLKVSRNKYIPTYGGLASEDAVPQVRDGCIASSRYMCYGRILSYITS